VQKFQVSATGHYELSFVTTSEMEISKVAVARSRIAPGEFTTAPANLSDSSANIVCFAEFVIRIFRAPLARQPPAKPMTVNHVGGDRGELSALAIYPFPQQFA